MKTAGAAIAVAALLLAQAPLTRDLRGGFWLDKPVRQWNIAGAKLPITKPLKRDEYGDERCSLLIRAPETDVEKRVTNAGWTLSANKAWSRHTAGEVDVVIGFESFGGQCRPFGEQAFVFVKGAFAGTLSPLLMDARADGELERITMLSSTEIQAVFLRYDHQKDPMCCPSKESVATYRIERRRGSPVVQLINSDTYPRPVPK